MKYWKSLPAATTLLLALSLNWRLSLFHTCTLSHIPSFTFPSFPLSHFHSFTLPHLVVGTPLELRTLSHSSFVSFPSPSLSARVNIRRTWNLVKFHQSFVECIRTIFWSLSSGHVITSNRLCLIFKCFPLLSFRYAPRDQVINPCLFFLLQILYNCGGFLAI